MALLLALVSCWIKAYPPFENSVYSSGGLRSAVGNMSGYRCVSDCRPRGREFDPGPVPYFHGDWSWNDFYGHSPPFRWFIQEGLLSVTSESMSTNYWLTACSSLSRKSVYRWNDRPAMTIAVDLGRKVTNKITKVQLASEETIWSGSTLVSLQPTVSTFPISTCVLLNQHFENSTDPDQLASQDEMILLFILSISFWSWKCCQLFTLVT